MKSQQVITQWLMSVLLVLSGALASQVQAYECSNVASYQAG